jgi:hypothetical protein
MKPSGPIVINQRLLDSTAQYRILLLQRLRGTWTAVKFG